MPFAHSALLCRWFALISKSHAAAFTAAGLYRYAPEETTNELEDGHSETD